MYRITCPNCGKEYDATKAADCSCLQPVRSFICPHCGACFCNNGRAFFDEFWKDAPPELWERRKSRTEHLTRDQNEPPDAIRRPMVLFADDDPVGRAIARQVVRNLGYGIIVAVNGEEALNMARDYKPELIITDALMPRLDGREMGKIIKDEMPSTKVVVITSVYRDPRYKHEAYRHFSIDEYLSKPIKPDDLRKVVEKYLDPK